MGEKGFSPDEVLDLAFGLTAEETAEYNGESMADKLARSGEGLTNVTDETPADLPTSKPKPTRPSLLPPPAYYTD